MEPWVKPMALASVASGADAIMLEVHPELDNSAVDPLQPVNFEAFEEIMNDMDTISRSLYKKKIKKEKI